MLKGIVLSLLAHSASSAETIPPFPDGVPGSGYGCDNPCNDADVHYVVRASLERYTIPNSAGTGLRGGNQDVSMLTRTFTGVSDQSSPFCRNDNGTSGPLGPCLTVNPGQTFKIKLINDMDGGMKVFGQHKAELATYWEFARQPGQPNLDNITKYDQAAPTPEEQIVINTQDLPGWDASFDDTNIHVHGLQVVPHLFYPLGTGNATADWISVQPASENPAQRCFCYSFELGRGHPQGTYFWHIHRHSSAAMQAWQGMIGLLQVGNASSPGAPDYELAQQGITRDEPFVLWEWLTDPNVTLKGEPNTLIEGQFLGADRKQTFLTNNDFQPNMTACVNETIHLRNLCAQTTTGSVLYLLNETGDTVPFWVFASDGISYDKAYQRTSVVVGPGMREGILVQFGQEGTYRFMQKIIDDFQGEIEEETASPALNIVVVADKTCQYSAIDMTALQFTPGMGTNNIQPEDICAQVTVNFQVGSLLNSAPVPQFMIDGKLFDYRHIARTVEAGAAQVWTLESTMNYFHPFHIHVNPFQVKSSVSPYLPGVLPTGETLLDAVLSTSLEPANMWRDTVFIPPLGDVVIYQRFGQSGITWSGKTLYHCHFLDHEDQGMISAMMIGDPQIVQGEASNTLRHDLATSMLVAVFSLMCFDWM